MMKTTRGWRMMKQAYRKWLSTINGRLSSPSQSWLQKGEVEELLMFHVLLESKPVVSGVVVWTIHQVFKSIADMAGKQPGYVLPAMSLYAKWTGTADEAALISSMKLIHCLTPVARKLKKRCMSAHTPTELSHHLAVVLQLQVLVMPISLQQQVAMKMRHSVTQTRRRRWPFQRIRVATMQTKMQNILPFDAVLQQRQLPYREGEQDRAISYEQKWCCRFIQS